jgi:PAS domain S-box-containing protein
VLKRDFAVILMDVQMPGMTGFETAQVIKSREKSRHIPIIFLTAISKQDDYVFEGYSAGAVDYILKPFNPAILRSKVTVFVELFMRGAKIRLQAQQLLESEHREMDLRHRAGLLESEARFAQIVESALDPIICFSDDRVIRVFNAAAERTFRMGAGAALATSIDRFLRNGIGELLEGRPRNPDDGPITRTSEIHEGLGVRGNGERFPIEYTVSTLELPSGRVHTLILRDVSERRRQEEVLRARTIALAKTMNELRVANEQLSERSAQLERAMGVRTRFYTSMSHELRTPINAILGYSSLLVDDIFGPLTEEQRGSVERTRLAANHLLELVNDILDLSKIEAGKMELQFEPVSMAELVHDLFVTVAPLAAEHGVELTQEVCDESIVSDPRRIRQIVLNLLSNAIKFGASKPVRVICYLQDARELVLEVHDQGAGIAPENQERIFEEFVQLEDDDKRGTGLGLPISRRLAVLLGGSLSVSSSVGEGSRFRLTLPLTPPEASDSEAEAATEPGVLS